MIDRQVHRQVSTALQQASEEIILPHYQNLKSGDVEEKSPGELVTVADRLSEEFLSESLSKILPEASIVGEEAVEADPSIMDRLNDGLTWVIDPIDGTSNFAAGKPPFGIIIALLENGLTRAGWLYDPLQKRLCHTELGNGAHINGIRIASTNKADGKPVAALATGFMTDEQRTQILAAAEPFYQIVDIPRCAAEQYPRLALGINHISVFERTLPWDHAAGMLFLNEAGGKAARWDGSGYLPADGRTGMLGASSQQLWDEAAKHLSHVFC